MASVGKRWGYVAAAIWLAALCAYVLAGVPLTTFHGDESMQISMSRDYAIAFLQRQPERLLVEPPYPIDSDAHLRILNGTINRYAIGLSWHLAAMTEDDLPPRPGWDWGLSYADGVASGHRLPAAAMNIMRASSALFTCGSVIALFLLGGRIGGAWLASITSALYTLHPVILLNGRRATQEGSLLFFGLLVILAAAIISDKQARGAKVSPLWWLALILAGGLTLASKHTGVVFVAGALLWLLAAEWVGRRRWRRLSGQITLSGVLIFAIFIGLSPALWNNPPARLSDLLAVRAELIDIQIAIDPLAPTTLMQRIESIVTQPFIAPPQHFELDSFGEAADFQAEIAAYMASPLSGWSFGQIIGILLTILAGVGIIAAARRRQGHDPGLMLWLLINAAVLLVNPIPWQRYYLPLLPVTTLLAGIGLLALCRWGRSLYSTLARQPTLRDT